MTKILKCSCVSEYQDARYGLGLRVHNSTTKPATPFRCTVCGKAH